jgi:hypothetical protein
MVSVGRAGLGLVTPQSALLYAESLDETRFLVEAAAIQSPSTKSRAATLIDVLTQLELNDRKAQGLDHQPLNPT